MPGKDRTMGKVVMLLLFAVALRTSLRSAHLTQTIPKEMAGWKTVTSDRVFNRSSIFDYMDGAGELYLAYDFRMLLVREYQKDGSPAIVAEIYEMSTPEDAYGVFTLDLEGREEGIGRASRYSQGLLRFWRGKVFVRIMAEQETSDAGACVLALGKAIAPRIANIGKVPPLVKALPPEGMLKSSEMFFHTPVALNTQVFLSESNILGLGPSAAAVTARYREGEARARLIMVHYSRPEQAHEAFGRFCFSQLNVTPGPEGQILAARTNHGTYGAAGFRGRSAIFVVEASTMDLAESLGSRAYKNIGGL